MLGPLATLSEQAKENIRLELGLDKPVFVQYLNYLGQILSGNLGDSYQLNQPVSVALGQALWPTVSLAIMALVLAVVFVILGILVARTYRWRAFIEHSHILATTLPIFWVSYLLLFVFAFGLGWFPAVSGDGLRSLWLPALALAIPIAGIIGQVFHSALLDARTQPFWVTVRSRGVSQLGFELRHASRHGLGSTVPLAVQIFGGLLGGAIIVEQVFSRSGLGSVALVAITNRDLPVVLGIVLLSAVFFSVLSAISDIAVWFIDPRTRSSAVSS